MHHLVRMLLLAMAAVGLGACSPAPAAEPVAPAEAAPQPADTAAIRKVVARWGHADDPRKICAVVSTRMITTTYNVADDCPTSVARMTDTGALNPGSVNIRVWRVARTGTRAAAEATIAEWAPDDKGYVFLVKEPAGWKVDNMTDRTSVPAEYRDLVANF